MVVIPLEVEHLMNDTNLDQVCREIRRLTLESIYSIGKGHVGGCMSIVEVLAVLYYRVMNVDPADPKMPGRDRLVVSKGHAGPAVYAALASRGYFPREELLTLNRTGTNLPSHCDMNKTPGIDMTTGSLGQGFSCAVGVAIGSELAGDGATVYTIIGDGESQEGQVWEAAMYAAHRGLSNLIAFTDCNRMQIDGMVDEVCSLGDLDAKWRAFGWYVQRVNGHDCNAIYEAIQNAKRREGQPSMILLDTIKGYGVQFAIDAGVGCHSMSVTKEQYEAAIGGLSGR
mgnify:FL=1